MTENALRRELQRTERFLELVLETGRMNGSFVDTELRHTWVAKPTLGVSKEEIIGKTDAELFTDAVSGPVMEAKREAIETESHVEREFTSIHSSRQNRYRIAAEPIYDTDDKLEGAMCAAIDLSGQYQFLERTTDSVFTVDSDWNVTFWNERIAERTDIEPGEIVGENIWDVYEERIPTELKAQFRRVMETGEPAETEQYLPEPFGYWVEIRMFADDDGLSVYSREITERKEYEQQLESQRDTLDILNQVLRHDIRNDLQMVSGYADLIAEQLDEEDKAYVETIQKRAEHAVELTRTAREISEVLFADVSENGTEELQESLLSEVEDIRAANSDAVVTVDEPVPDVMVSADDMLPSVFRNLLKNAVLHNDKQVPEITVTIDERDDEIIVRVADNGPGIPDNQKEKIFGKGEKGLDSEGTGIGLYLVQTLVEGYGGSIEVEDNEPEGAVFSVTLPKAA
ncbi:PAS domain-containing protein [Halogeometricum borinquense]|uniref:histidine kinase n=1 Tax=Halogeometricum borinquense TaxID=60847 RepID=A0A482T9N3_9EURY|nr:ATP-binding protein [Halogeometricum borinquense]RYJ08669.1 PAS domain-containing protein [Halogeometricum borinquense]